MKKVLLSISMLAAVMTASAQNFVLYDAATGTSPFNGDAFIFSPGVNSFDVDTAATAPHTITVTGNAPSNCPGGTGTDPCYYINGFGNGRYDAGGTPEAIGYDATNFAADKFFMNVFTNGYSMKVKVQFTTYTAGVADADLYGYEFDLAAAPNDATAGFIDASVDIDQFSKIVSDNPDNTNFLTSTLAQKIGKIEFAIVLTGTGGTGPGEVQLRNMTIGASSVTAVKKQSPVSNLSVYPNPASDIAVVKYSAPTETLVSVADLQGNVVKTINGSNANASINTSDLASGIYVVTVAVDGIPSAPQKLVVK